MRYIISFLLASTAMPAFAEAPQVMTDIPPVYALTAQVMAGIGTPTLLLDRGASEHDFQLRPSQAAEVAAADLVIWVGPELTPWLDRAVDNLGPEARQLALLSIPDITLRDYEAAHDDHAGHDGEEGHDTHQDHNDTGHDDHAGHSHDSHAEEGHAEEGHAEEGQGDHAGHSHSGTDPHAWLDPGNAQAWVKAIASELSSIDPDNAQTYAANAEKAVADIAALDAQLATRLAAARDKPFFVFHDAYGYFAAHYGLTVAGAISMGDATAPGAARLDDMRGKIAEGSPCLFPEPQHDPKLMLQLAEGTNGRIGGAIDPNGSSYTPGPDGYAQLMTGLADTILACVAP